MKVRRLAMDPVLRFLRGPDPHYTPCYISTKWNQARRQRVIRQHRDFEHRWDTRTQEEVDRATFGKWYDLARGVMNENAHVDRVAKAQAALRHWKGVK